MRIALVAPLVSPIAQPYTGGAQALIADLAHGLHQRGHEVTLFARAGSSLAGVAIESIAVPESVRPTLFTPSSMESEVSATRAQSVADAGFFAQANLFLELFLQLERRHDEFDLVHAHAFDWPAYTCSALVTSIPVLHTLHLPAISLEINAALRALDRQGHPLTLVTVSQSCAHTYASTTRIDHVIPNGLDVEAIPFQPTVARNAPLLCAGRIAPEKGVEAAIAIAEQANYPLVLAGNIYDREYYEQRIAPRIARAGSRVTYIGPLERQSLWRLMGHSTALLCPLAWDEPFGLVPVEAMATGTPVIAFRRGAMQEIIQHGETGFLVEPGECDHAAALVEDILDIPRARCRAHVEEHFTLERMLEAYEQAYQHALSGSIASRVSIKGLPYASN